MAENADWKQKYRDSLLDMEREEKRWSRVEQALRHLVGRLCAAGMGVDPELDRELMALAAANRRNADTEELERLAASLRSAVVAVDAASPLPAAGIPAGAPAPARWDTTCAAAARVLQHLKSVGIEGSATAALISQLPLAKSDADLADVLEQTAELVRAHAESLAQERLQAAAMLGDFTNRLEEMADYLAESGDDTRSRFADSASMNDTVISQVRELSAEVRSATDLRALQGRMSACLETVTKQIVEFRAREESRLLEFTGRADRMRARIAHLERETLDLHSKLDRERHGARLDPLTQLANRKSCDERFGKALERHAQSDLPVSMLLFDLDNFKLINDSYGHRAGDRVLQSVAACFLSKLRAEDFVARIGGEEFVILLSGLPFAGALKIADELRRSVAALRFHFRGAPVRVTISCGLTDLRADDETASAFDRADSALYQAKHGGKNLCIAA
jgi:diguanylate cyclase